MKSDFRILVLIMSAILILGIIVVGFLYTGIIEPSPSVEGYIILLLRSIMHIALPLFVLTEMSKLYIKYKKTNILKDGERR